MSSCDITYVVQAVVKAFFFWPAATSVSTLLPPTELRAGNRIPDWRTAVSVCWHVSLVTCQMMTLVCDGLQSWNKEQEQGKASQTLGFCARVAFPGNQTKKINLKKKNLHLILYWGAVDSRCAIQNLICVFGQGHWLSINFIYMFLIVGEMEAHRGSPHRQEKKHAYLGIKPRTFMLWGNHANQHASNSQSILKTTQIPPWQP